MAVTLMTLAMILVMGGGSSFELANAQSCSSTNLPAGTAGIFANLTAGSYNATTFPGPSIYGECSCGGAQQQAAYVFSGSSNPNLLNEQLASSTSTAFPLLQCTGGSNTLCICSSSNCFNMVGSSAGVYLVTYCNASTSPACQIYAVLNCFSSGGGGALIPSNTVYLNGVQRLKRYTCSLQVLANNTWASLATGGIFPAVSYATCGGMCPQLIPSATPANCTKFALVTTPATAPTTPISVASNCTLPNGTSVTIIDESTVAIVQLAYPTIAGYCPCSTPTLSAQAVFFWPATLLQENTTHFSYLAFQCYNSSSKICVCDVDGDCWVSYGAAGNSSQAGVTELVAVPYCDNTTGCYTFVYPSCSASSSAVGLNNTATGESFNCLEPLDILAYEFLPAGGLSPYIKAASIDCLQCANAASMSIGQCDAPYNGSAQQTPPGCITPANTSSVFIATDPTLGFGNSTPYTLPQLIGVCNCAADPYPGNITQFVLASLNQTAGQNTSYVYSSGNGASLTCINSSATCVFGVFGGFYQWTPSDSTLESLILAPYCDDGGCHIYVLPVCSAPYTGGLVGKSLLLQFTGNTTNITCEQAMEYSPVGSTSPYPQAVSIDCDDCQASSQFLSYWYCEGPMVSVGATNN